MLSLVRQVAGRSVRGAMLPYRFTPVRHHGYEGGKVGVNLPFRIDNHFRFTALFIVFSVTGLSAPWFLLRFLML